jgi:hypothetical protein
MVGTSTSISGPGYENYRAYGRPYLTTCMAGPARVPLLLLLLLPVEDMVEM